jgi:hypothetical protein
MPFQSVAEETRAASMNEEDAEGGGEGGGTGFGEGLAGVDVSPDPQPSRRVTVKTTLITRRGMSRLTDDTLRRIFGCVRDLGEA